MATASTSFEHLVKLTSSLETDIPSIRGSFPDFAELEAQLAAAAGRRSTYALGTIKSGKSTFLSALVGGDILPRGSGVKTFNLSRLFHSGTPSASIAFKSKNQLAAMLAFDFRMLGVAIDVPEDPYDPAMITKIAQQYEDFERMAQDDGRLDYLLERNDEQRFLSMALARVRLLITCLKQLQSEIDPSTLAVIRTRQKLTFEGDRFDDYRCWAASSAYAVIIQDLSIGTPFPSALPADIALVDCQGSDSLNPLDFAAVDAALHRADRIVYVVNSRLGLRLADKELLLHIQRAGLSPKAALIYNIEAFEPLAAADFVQMKQKLSADLAAMKLSAMPVFPLCALLALNQAVSPNDASIIHQIWQARGLGAVLREIEDGFSAAVQQIAQSATDDATPASILPILLHRAQTTAKALLARDRQMLGLQSTELDEEEVRTAIRRILAGEKSDLNKKLSSLAFATFASHADLQSAINQFLRSGPQQLLQSHPLPDRLRGTSSGLVKHGAILAAALEGFNTEWMLLGQQLRLQHINPFVEKAYALILESLAHMYRLIPGVLASKLAELSSHALPPHERVMAMLRERLAQLATTTMVPEILRPVVIMPVVVSGLAGEFYARGLLAELKAKLARSKPALKADVGKTQRLWDRTFAAAFKAARDDQEFSVSSARENFRFQYFGKMVDALFQAFEEIVMESVDQYFVELKRLDATSKLLLSGVQRQRVEEYLNAL